MLGVVEVTVPAEGRDHRRSDAERPGPGGLGAEQTRDTLDHRQRAADADLAGIEVRVHPSQPEELAAAGAGPEREMP